MKTTKKRITVRLTKQDNEMVKELKKKLLTTTSDIIKRALIAYYEKIINQK